MCIILLNSKRGQTHMLISHTMKQALCEKHLFTIPARILSMRMCIQNLVSFCQFVLKILSNQRTNGPVNAHLISWPSKAQNIQTLENIL